MYNITNVGCQGCLDSDPGSPTYWLHIPASYLNFLCLFL